MATTKSYTDLEQSKKLAEILPLESADMYYDRYEDPYFINESVTHERIKNDKYYHLISCWSLAALLNVLPNNEHTETTLSRGGWKIEPIEYVDNWWCEYEDEIHTKNFSTSANNPVDACVEMILKLKEKNLL